MCVILYTSYIPISTSRRWDGVHEAIARREKPVGVRLSQCSWKWSRSRFSEMTFSPTYAGDVALVYHPPVVPRKPIYVRKAGYSRYRVRRFSPHGCFRFAIRASSAVSAPVVYSPQANVGWYRVSCVLIFRIRAFFVSHKKTKIPRNPIPTHSFLHYYIWHPSLVPPVPPHLHPNDRTYIK